jgi:hypothetical protein
MPWWGWLIIGGGVACILCWLVMIIIWVKFAKNINDSF